MDTVLARTQPYNIGPRASAALAASGLRKAEAARRMGMAWTQLHKICLGQRPEVSAETVRRLAKALGCTTDYLLGMDEEEG